MKHILLVEDNDDDAFAFQRALKKAGIENELCILTDGQQVVDYLQPLCPRPQSGHPLVIFLDLKLPYISGHEVLEWIRAQVALESVPVVILSGSDEGRDHERAKLLGALSYMLKPPSPSDLSELIRDLQQQDIDLS